jgi:hypothetical protein
MTNHRLTIIARDANKLGIDWTCEPHAGEAIAFIDSTRAIGSALWTAAELGLDIGRVIVDRAATPDQFLELLAALPQEFVGDMLFIRDDGSGVMSATGRGGDRLLYSLKPNDVRFYLEANTLVMGRVMMEKSA